MSTQTSHFDIILQTKMHNYNQ